MKHITFIGIFCYLFVSCGYEPVKDVTAVSGRIESVLDIPDITVGFSDLSFDKMTSLWSLDNTLFSGYAVSYFQDSILREKTTFLNGRKQNLSTLWYPDGHQKLIENYHHGKLNGEKKKWSDGSQHILVAHLNYKMNKGHGLQTLWYKTGELYKKVNLNMGIEKGMQQAFRKNGALYANYEAKEGRIFGLKKTALCYGLDDEIIQYEE